MNKQDSINNSFQILEEFIAKKAHKLYYAPRKPRRRKPEHEKPGSVKVLSEEEVYLYRLKKYEHLFKNLTICGE